MAMERLAKEEETHAGTVRQHFEETKSLRGKIKELQNIAHQNLAMRKHTEEQKAQLLDSNHHLAVESTLELEWQRDSFLKEIADTSA